MAILRVAGKLWAVGHGGGRFNFPLWPPFWPSRDPLLLRIFPVPSDTLSMDRGPLTELAGESSPSAMAPGHLEQCSG